MKKEHILSVELKNQQQPFAQNTSHRSKHALDKIIGSSKHQHE
jgi:hypothetical protein